MKSTTSDQKPVELVRSLGLVSATSLVVGTILGTGIFLKTTTMSQQVGSVKWVLLAWVVAGVLSLAGSLTYAELSSRFPSAGGEYIFLKEGYGAMIAFLYGWQRFGISSPASIAAYGVGGATFLNGFVSLDKLPGKTTTVALFFVIFFTIINCFSVRSGGWVQTALTFLKVILVLGIILGILLFSSSSPISSLSATASQIATPKGFGAALIAALWAYDGWNNMPMASGEVNNPKKTLPFALIFGTLLIITIYIAINIAYFYALPFSEVISASSSKFPSAPTVASKAIQTFLSPKWATFLALGMVISALGAMNGSILTGARVPFAMARDGLFFGFLATLSKSSRVPVASVLIQGVWACVLALSGTFDQLTDLVVFASWIFYALAAGSLLIIRHKENKENKKNKELSLTKSDIYKVWGYPVLPLVFILCAFVLLVNTLISMPKESAIGLIIIALGLPVYAFYKA